MKKIRVGINGFGRIGRTFFRAAWHHPWKDMEIVYVNNLSDAYRSAQLLKYDSTFGKAPFSVDNTETEIIVDGKKIAFSAHRDPADIPWDDLKVDMVFECSGVFKERVDIEKHFKPGVKKVMVSGPAPGVDVTLVCGVNHDSYDPAQHNIVSNGSCTTNCLAPLAKVLDEHFSIEHGLITTVHAYTGDQCLLDSNHSDLRRARSAALSMVPTSTGAAKAVGLVLPHLKGKIDGLAVRVPTPNVSLVDFVARTKKPLSVEKINKALQQAAAKELKGILYCEAQPLVSCDFNGNAYSSIVDLSLTMALEDHMCKVLSWYDNEMGFSTRMVDLAQHMVEAGW